MRRQDVFRNVAFGGAWSERIYGVERRQKALEKLKSAIDETCETDLRGNIELTNALIFATAGIPKSLMLQKAWNRALENELAAHRVSELSRIYKVIEAAVGTAARF